jgi:hypothetical protein
MMPWMLSMTMVGFGVQVDGYLTTGNPLDVPEDSTNGRDIMPTFEFGVGGMDRAGCPSLA